MKRILAVLGVTGLALLGATVPAAATDDSEDDHQITICHATGWEDNPYEQISVDFDGVKWHAQHGDDIIPGNRKWDGKNWDEDGRAIYYNGCVPCPEEEEPVVPEEPVVVVPPEEPVVPPEEPVVVVPPEEPVVVVPPVVTPIGAVVAPPAAPAAVVRNPGFNVQTAVAPSDTVLAPWAAGLIVMLLAAAGVAARKVLPAGGVSRNRKD